MYSLTELAQELQDDVKWQVTPQPIRLEDYQNMILKGLKKLYLDTGRASGFNKTLVYRDEDDGDLMFEYQLPLDEELYVLLIAKIQFFRRVQADANNQMGYTTDALTVTGADKPYANLKDTILNLQNERRINYYKMHRYTTLSS